ncbi:glycosyltransferase family 4 protein [Dyadobacter psychrotolerans]|uniref:glycosyltransferase family 4 protein n=1 Tax=Dyadobacter psychrotolerans TaxID=2541721 RepID=UPI001E2F9003|nr:glycosyltransferase family 1 protein [Dyadobacter psychrotolerans]
MKKIKIAFFAEILIEDFDGASRTMFQIIRRIPQQHFEFLFICGKGPDELFGFECVCIPTLTVPFNKSYSMALPYLADKTLREKLSAFDPDIIHIATPSLLGSFALQYARSLQLPVISIYHTHFISYISYYLSKAPFLIDLVKAKLMVAQKNFYNQCELVYVPSESIAAEMQQMGISQSGLKLWKRGIDTHLFSPEKRDTTSLRLTTGNNNPNILFASRLVWEKNLETLIRIYEYCQSKNLKYNFIIAGDGIAKKACQQKMNKAFFTGSLQHAELAKLYASADVFLFTSVSETYGNVVLEAMACGLPCVIADGGGSRDFIEQGINGFKCQPQNHADYVDKIQTILSDDPLRARFSQKGRSFSLDLDWDKLTDVYFDDLQSMAGVLHI